MNPTPISAVNVAGSSPLHPHLYFAPHDLQALRRKASDQRVKADWDAIRAAATAALDGPSIPVGDSPETLARASAAAASCAFVFQVTGDAAYERRANDICNAILDADGWTGDFLGLKGGSRFHLHSAAICQNLALAYDILAPRMTAAERKHFADVCWTKALRLYLQECRTGDNVYLNGSRTMNWLAVLSSGAGCLFIALDGDAYDFSREIEIARAHLLRFIEWYDDDGSAIEHGSYWIYGMGNALHFLRALELNGWPKIMQQYSRKLDRCAYPVIYGCINGKHVTNFCDDFHGPFKGRDNSLFLAASFKDPVIQWFADQLPPGGILGLVTSDPDLVAAPPKDLPTCMVFQRTGIAVLRESMTDPQTRLLGLKAARARSMIMDDAHCQFDLNSIILEAFGATLLADPGYGHNWTKGPTTEDPQHPTNSTPPHNTLLVDGRGQEYQWSPFASLDDLSPSADIDYVVSRIEQGYGPKVARFDRHAYFIDKRFFILLDDVELTAPAKLTWNFHGAKSATVAADTATITNESAQLHILPTASTKLSCARKDDHVLPRLQFDSDSSVTTARVAWLLIPSRANSPVAAPKIVIHPDHLLVTEGAKSWRLPIVQRRIGYKSSYTLIRAAPKP